MAKGQNAGAHGRTRRTTLPRVGSAEGNFRRAQIRAAHPAKFTGKYAQGSTVPGSRNPRKVGRG
jgi:hypothetical protein